MPLSKSARWVGVTRHNPLRMVMGGVVFPAQKVLNADALRHTQQRRKFSCVYSRLRGNDTMSISMPCVNCNIVVLKIADLVGRSPRDRRKCNVGENPSCRCHAKLGYRHMGLRLSSVYGAAICVQANPSKKTEKSVKTLLRNGSKCV